VLSSPYKLPFANGTIDIVISGQPFEHRWRDGQGSSEGRADVPHRTIAGPHPRLIFRSTSAHLGMTSSGSSVAHGGPMWLIENQQAPHGAGLGDSVTSVSLKPIFYSADPFFFLGPCNNVFILMKRECPEKDVT
jgi:hypothetical protein